ncbi:ACT domain-containing protein [Caenispirillum bisanense]|uniref:ACT domain-containing protein n=1 Tax=Caenispirillum bisanense TaxID=414052 RepID=UPI0031D1B1A5
MTGPAAPGPTLTLTLRPGSLAICRLPAAAPVPDWAWQGTFHSITRTPDELSVICDHAAATAAPAAEGLRVDGPWRVFEVQGPFAFEVTGVVAALSRPLAEAGIGIFVLSTFDTDWILVKATSADSAAEAWRAAGHTVAAG